jgi:hypothetical protein
MKKLLNGDLLYSHNENIPNEIEGYSRDNYNLCLFHLEYLSCRYREQKSKRLACGKLREYEYCKLKDCLISKLYCSQCKDRKLIIIMIKGNILNVFFSPNGGCTDEIISLLKQAKKTIKIQCYVFTSKPINDALIQVDKNLVRINMVIDAIGSIGHNCLVDDLIAHSKAIVKVDRKHPIAHNKIIIIDDECVITGSFNFSDAAEHKNAENLVVIQNSSDIIDLYLKNFDLHWNHSIPYVKSKIILTQGYMPEF